MTTNLEKRNELKAALSREESTFIDSIIKADPKFYFMDGFVAELMAEGFPVQSATKAWAMAYTGSNSFVCDVARKLNTGKVPSPKQARGLLNAAMKDAQERASASSGDSDIIAVIPFPEPTHPCFVCGEKFYTVKEAANHRVKVHVGASALEPDKPRTPRTPAPYRRKCSGCEFVADSFEAMREHRKEHYKPLFDGVEQSGIDLDQIGEGRFAVPMLDGTDYYFLSIKKVHSTKERTKKFRFGWITYGSEEVLAGTYEVRQWRGETKELIGEQRPGETYRGAHLDEFRMILEDPVASAKLFGVIHKRCGRCGTSLTDPESRRLAIGPECIKHYSDPKVHLAAPSKEELTEHMRGIRTRLSPWVTPTIKATPPPYSGPEVADTAPFAW